MKALSKKLMTAMALTLGFNGAAFAGSVLSTPTLFQGSAQNVCVATNVSNNPVTVTVKMVTLLSGVIQNTCTIPPGDPSGCQEAANDLAYCQVSVLQGSPKSVRVVMMNRNTTAPFTINATVEGR
jgi:hypothetical protein